MTMQVEGAREAPSNSFCNGRFYLVRIIAKWDLQVQIFHC